VSWLDCTQEVLYNTSRPKVRLLYILQLCTVSDTRFKSISEKGVDYGWSADQISMNFHDSSKKLHKYWIIMKDFNCYVWSGSLRSCSIIERFCNDLSFLKIFWKLMIIIDFNIKTFFNFNFLSEYNIHSSILQRRVQKDMIKMSNILRIYNSDGHKWFGHFKAL